MERAVLFVNLFSGSLMVGGFVFGAVTVARAHVELPPREAWRFHQYVSRRVDWFIPPSAFTATISGWVLLAVSDGLARRAFALTLLGAVLLTSYGAPFTGHPTGLRNEVVFTRLAPDEVELADALQRMQWWNGWHYYRTAVGSTAQICYILAALLR